ncbi:zinc finger CCHC domain-containing protein 7 isoform X2 [Alligator mississippiensis]|uniref:zinc finger CCHC domain-containing protein 7 isoform X2 n=1 Tax=Alligator mississippiensis TaxID=8496 RepID=UPI0009076506|nr:zinc finger CCHC domain-containing protein 7 isoform X2 [Alligator mississippiensis]
MTAAGVQYPTGVFMIRVNFLSKMFDGYEDLDAYEDDLYREESSSELSVDSEVEFHLYSQVHYAQNLGEINGQEENKQVGSIKKEGQSSVLTNKLVWEKNIIELSDSDFIQISDGPEVIILSDTADEDSIYKSKVKKTATSLLPNKISNCPGNSTRNRARASKHNSMASNRLMGETSCKEKMAHVKSNSISIGASMIQEILVIEDSSNGEEEKESTVSESDNLESWMLLEYDKDDKDEDIILNVEGCGTSVSEGESGVNWSISDKDLEAQICNYPSLRRNNRYYATDKNVTCRNCNKQGHLSKNCPTPKKMPPCCLCSERGHLQNTCPARFCLNCCLPGHYSKECLERAYWSKRCNRCDMKGHYADACPEIWRQYHLTTKPGPIKKASSSEYSIIAYCYNCSRKGHYGYECSERRMYGGVFPSSPFIYYYDNKYDIKSRAKRLKRKIEELQEVGLLPVEFKRPCMEEEHMRHCHKKKKKLWKEHDKPSKREKHHKKPKKKSQAEKHKDKKQRKGIQNNQDGEEDFPRGCKAHVPKASKKYRRSVFQPHSDKMRNTQELVEAVKKKKKNQQNERDWSPTTHESLFLIKQRKKKSKQKSRC